MAICYLLLGSNIGNREENLKRALFLLESKGVGIKARSSIYETEPWGFTDQPTFYNQAVEVETSYTPDQLLEELKQIEEFMGREDFGRWRERLIDIDIIYYGETVMKNNKLTIPHPEMQLRKFVLLPLTEIAPQFQHPVLKLSNKVLLDRCDDKLRVTKVIR